MKIGSEMRAWNEECGVMGVVGVPNAAGIAARTVDHPLDLATQIEPRAANRLPSTKGKL